MFEDLEKHRENAYWLWHDLLDILVFIAPDWQTWTDEITVLGERELVTQVLTQSDSFLEICWYWLDQLNDNNDVY